MTFAKSSFWLAAGAGLACVPVLAAMPVDPATLDARCLITTDAAAKAGQYKDMRQTMLRGFFAGRVMARSGKEAGKAAVAQARKDMRIQANVPSSEVCAAVLDTFLAQAYPE